VAVAALGWAVSGDPVRALAVLVVATPCPLILAAPVAFLAGISQAARRGIIVKGGAALEALAGARTMMLDKTGTVTRGEPAVVGIETFGDVAEDELLRLAASLDQVSPHVLAAAIVKSARDRRLALSFPSKVEERLGTGIEGEVEGRRIALGRLEWVAQGHVPERAAAVRFQVAEEGHSNVWVGVDGALAGVLILADPLRDDAAATIAALRDLGVGRIILVTGDHRAVAERVGAKLGIDRVLFEQTPFDKVEAVKAETREGPTAMVGDGVNDAPALAAASVGVALGARGATASSEAADVVLMLDRFDRVLDALKVSRRAQGIARQSVLAGMGLSLAAMAVAAAGYLPPVAGALFQEAIDVAVIVNALRALTPGRG
jgi:heavy metal translocating P-type ATPase